MSATPILDALRAARHEREQHERARLAIVRAIVRGPISTDQEADDENARSIALDVLNRSISTADSITLDAAGWPVMEW